MTQLCKNGQPAYKKIQGTILKRLESGQLQPEWDRHTLFIRRFHWLQLVSELERRNSWVLESHVDAF